MRATRCSARARAAACARARTCAGAATRDAACARTRSGGRRDRLARWRRSTGPIPMDVIDVSDGGSNGRGLQELEAFALIDEVAQEGPAAAAGVCRRRAASVRLGARTESRRPPTALARRRKRSAVDRRSPSLLVRRKVSPTIEVSGGGSGEGAVAVSGDAAVVAGSS